MVLQTYGGAKATVLGLSFVPGDVEVFNFEVEGVANYFVRGSEGDGPGVLVHNGCGDVALGVNKGGRIERFANEMGFGTYWSRFSDTSDMQTLGSNLETLMHEADSLHFNLDGMAGSVDDAVKWGREGLGQGNVTDWELAQVADDPSLLMKTTFYRNGEVVSKGALPR